MQNFNATLFSYDGNNYQNYSDSSLPHSEFRHQAYW